MSWHAHFDEVSTTGGMVTAPEQLAADAGAALLARGGNAVDAAVAAALALAVVEPEMSGLGGGTLMTIRMDGRTTVLDGAIFSPAAAGPAEFPLSDREDQPEWAVSFYDWPLVQGATNVLGPRAVGVPGTVAALLGAHDRFGARPRAEVFEPAIGLAADGFEIHWFLAALIASNARSLGRDEGCSEVFLRGGLPLRGPDVRRAQRLVQPRLAETLAALAADGAAAFYEGPVGHAIVRCVTGGGGLLTAEDLAAYRLEVHDEPPSAVHGDLELVGPPGTGFPSVVQALAVHDAAAERGIDQGALRWAYASKVAMVDRFLHMSADPDDTTPWQGLTSRRYAADRLAAELDGTPVPDPGEYSDEPSAPPRPAGAPASGGYTSHHSVVDGDGNAVSVTQTVLNTFGARVLDPATGVLLNDGMAYFDPRQGHRNCIRPSGKAFSAMSPVIALRGGEVAAVYGASGGRRIIAGVAQMTDALARGASMQEAVEEPRVYAESDVVLLDVRWPADAGAAIAAAGFNVEPTDEQPTTVHFARPNGITVGVDGQRRSGLDPKKPAGVATVAR